MPRVDHRSRGNAAQMLEKYKTLARDSQLQGDRITAEYYLQYADHYFRVLNEGRPRFEEQRGRRDWQEQEDGDGDAAVDEGDDRDERAPDRAEPRADRYDGRERAERPEARDRPYRNEARDRSDGRDRSEARDRGDGRERSDMPRERPEQRDRADDRERSEGRRDRYDGARRDDRPDLREARDPREPRREARPDDRRDAREDAPRRESRGGERSDPRHERDERGGWRDGRGRDERDPDRLNGAEAEHGESIAAVLPPAFNRTTDVEAGPVRGAEAPARRTRGRLSARMDADGEPGQADEPSVAVAEESVPAPRKRGRPRKVVPPEGAGELTFENV